jgi:hypothetical protein
MPLLIGAGRVREEGSGRVVAATWKRRSAKYLDEREPNERERLLTEAGRRHLMRVVPGLAVNLTPHEIATVSELFGRAIQRAKQRGGR